VRVRIALALAAVLAFSAQPAFAQWSIGAKGGVGFASLSSDDAFVNEVLDDGRTGLVIGGFVESPFIGPVSIALEGLYTQKGARGEGVEFDDNTIGDLSANIDYVEVPVLVKVVLSPSETQPFVYGGFASAFKTSATLKSGDETILVDDGTADGAELDEQIKSTEASVVFGGGMKFGQMGVEARYTKGLTAIQKATLSGQDIKNQQFTILVSYAIGR
jgi:hypothetical protein